MGLRSTPKGAIMDEAALDQWAKDTNGEPFSKETKEELLEYIDMTDAGDLTYVYTHTAIIECILRSLAASRVSLYLFLDK